MRVAVVGKAGEEETERAGEVMAGHTPGPWYIEPTGERTCNGPTVSIDQSPLKIVARPDWHLDHEEYMANARLIAAAPDLLEALHDCLTIVQDEYDEDPEPEDLTSWKRAIDAARAAIAKATEQPPVPSA